jgi:hypothetical protein
LEDYRRDDGSSDQRIPYCKKYITVGFLILNSNQRIKKIDVLSSYRTRIVELVIKANFSKVGEVIESGEEVASFEELALDIECVS